MIKPEAKNIILTLRQQGESFADIAKLLSLSPNTVKSICYRSNIQTIPAECSDTDVCKNCGKQLVQTPGKKKKTFCSSECRTKWWNKTRKRKPYHLICYHCGKEFVSFGNRKKKFCSQECYRQSRHSEEIL